MAEHRAHDHQQLLRGAPVRQALVPRLDVRGLEVSQRCGCKRSPSIQCLPGLLAFLGRKQVGTERLTVVEQRRALQVAPVLAMLKPSTGSVCECHRLAVTGANRRDPDRLVLHQSP